MLSGERRILTYWLVEELGSDRLGSVYRAEDARARRTVILHVLRIANVVDQDRVDTARAALHQRLRAASRVSHPSLATILDVARHEDLDLVAIEDVAGDSLADLLARGAPPPADEALWHAEELSGALARAHARGVTHGRITLHNIRIGRDGRAHLLDLGVPRAVDVVYQLAGRMEHDPTPGIRVKDCRALAGVIRAVASGVADPAARPDAAALPELSRAIVELAQRFEQSARPSARQLHGQLLELARRTPADRAAMSRPGEVVPEVRKAPPRPAVRPARPPATEPPAPPRRVSRPATSTAPAPPAPTGPGVRPSRPPAPAPPATAPPPTPERAEQRPEPAPNALQTQGLFVPERRWSRVRRAGFGASLRSALAWVGTFLLGTLRGIDRAAAWAARHLASALRFLVGGLGAAVLGGGRLLARGATTLFAGVRHVAASFASMLARWGRSAGGATATAAAAAGSGLAGARAGVRRAFANVRVRVLAASLSGALVVIAAMGILSRPPAPAAPALEPEPLAPAAAADPGPALPVTPTPVPAAELSPQAPADVGALRISVSPRGARVSLDGGPWRPAPVTFLELPAMQYTIRVARSGYPSLTDTVTIEAGDTLRRSYSLTPAR